MNKLIKIKHLLLVGFVAAYTTGAIGQEVSTDFGNYAGGEEIVVTFSNGPGNPKDWVGLYKHDMVAGKVDSLAWFYVDGTQTGSESFTDGELTFPEGMTDEGIYQARFFENNDYTLLAKVIFTVGDIGPTAQRMRWQPLKMRRVMSPW